MVTLRELNGGQRKNNQLIIRYFENNINQAIMNTQLYTDNHTWSTDSVDGIIHLLTHAYSPTYSLMLTHSLTHSLHQGTEYCVSKLPPKTLQRLWLQGLVSFTLAIGEPQVSTQLLAKYFSPITMEALGIATQITGLSDKTRQQQCQTLFQSVKSFRNANPSINMIGNSLTHSLTHSLIHSPCASTHALTNSLHHSPTHSLTHLLANVFLDPLNLLFKSLFESSATEKFQKDNIIHEKDTKNDLIHLKNQISTNFNYINGCGMTWNSAVTIARLLTHSLTYLLLLTRTHLLTYSPTHSLTHSLVPTHSLTNSLGLLVSTIVFTRVVSKI